jgi:1-acyl-sn-glycerol-3-phosphate acyltransferase
MQVNNTLELPEQNRLLEKPGVVADAFSTFIATLFYIGIRSTCRVEVTGLNNYSGSPSTLVVSNHKRDLDMLVIAPTLHFGDRFPRPFVRPYFAARDDEFAPGFLATYYKLPEWINRLLFYKLNISPVMRAFRAYPMRQAHPASTNQALREVLEMTGNLELGRITQESWLQTSADSLSMPINELRSITIKDFLTWRYLKVLSRKADPIMLEGSFCRRMRLVQGRAIRKQLDYFARLLNQGEILFLAPEGELSPDGRLCPIRGSLYRLINMSKNPVKILPMNISYDFMTTSKIKAFLNIGPEIPYTKEMPKTELEPLVKDSLIKLTTVTMSQIGSYFLYQESTRGTDILIEASWREQLAIFLQKIVEAGIKVDKALLEEKSLCRTFKNFLGYCLQKGQLISISPGKLKINKESILNSLNLGHSDNPVYYCHNELSTLVSSRFLSLP